MWIDVYSEAVSSTQSCDTIWQFNCFQNCQDVYVIEQEKNASVWEGEQHKYKNKKE